MAGRHRMPGSARPGATHAIEPACPLQFTSFVRCALACATAAALSLAGHGQRLGTELPHHPRPAATAEQVAQAGVPLSELAPNAPDSYTIKRGDTLWAISGLFLKSPWRWPELWGMNLQDIRNPHLIYPGQTLYLDKSNGRATPVHRADRAQWPTAAAPCKVSPRTRYESLSDSAIPPVNLQAIEAFLTEAHDRGRSHVLARPRIVATPENRVLLTKGDRAYARAQYGDTPSVHRPGQRRQAHRLPRVPQRHPAEGPDHRRGAGL